ncbi:MAG: sigma-70 family RNA polymerase sigma factor [Ardenticatenaceae bacterium]
MVYQFSLRKENLFQPECENEPHVSPSKENQADEGHYDVALSNDPSLFWGLWQEYECDLYQNCFKFMGNQQDAEDLLAEVMLQARRAWEQPREITNLKGWLFRVSSNLCINMQVKNQRRRADYSLDQMIEAGQEMAANVPLPENLLLLDEMHGFLSQAIGSLPSRLRECARQHFLLEIGYQEIAHQMAISMANVRKRIQEARSLLKESAMTYLSDQVVTQTGAPFENERKFESNTPVDHTREIHAPVVNMFVVVPVRLFSGVVRTFHVGVANKPARLQQKLDRCRAYVEQYPKGWKKRLELAEVLYQMGRWEEAIDPYQEVLVKQPHLLEVSLRLGHMFHLLERKQEAIEVYRHAFSQARQPATKYHLHGLMARLNQQYEAAVTSFEAAIALDPENVLHWHELGELYLEREAYGEALRAFDRALALNQNDPSTSSGHRIVALSGRYEPLVALGHHKEAQRTLNRMLELAPKDVRTLTRLADTRLQMGVVHGEKGKETKRLILAARREAPYAPEISASLASYYFCRGKRKKGTAVLEAFVSEYPTNPRGWIHYARVLEENGQKEAAQEAIQRHASLMARVSGQIC